MDEGNNEVDPFEQFFLYGNPNPDRVGCPGPEVIRGLATRELPIDHPAREHLGKCSPCFREFKAIVAARRIADERRRKRPLLVTAAAVILVGLVAFAAYRSGIIGGKGTPPNSQNTMTTRVAPQPVPPTFPDSPTTIVALDFRQVGVERGIGSVPAKVAGRIPKKVVALQITLPFASDDGVYSVEVRRLQDNSLVKASEGTARILNGETRLNVARLDFSDVRAGQYTFLFRHADAHWSKAAVMIVEKMP